MTTFTLRMVFLVAVGTLCARSSIAQLIRTQAPCAPSTTLHCFSFDHDDPIPIRAFAFNAPRPGTAQVTFHGSMTCSGITFVDSLAVDLISQIVTNPNAVANAKGPGGLRHAARLARDDHGGGNSFNLTSTRVVTFAAAGPRTFYFKLSRLRMDALTQCFVYNAAFSITFVP